MPRADDDGPDLGTCCICSGDIDVHAIIMLSVKCPVRGRGWGCVVCDLPADGANAVICDTCVDGWQRGYVKLQFACRGWAGQDGRVPIAELTEPHYHDPMVEH